MSDDEGVSIGEPTRRAFEDRPGLFQPTDHDGKWQCTECEFEYSERIHAATCCVAPGRPPDWDSAIAATETENDGQ